MYKKRLVIWRDLNNFIIKNFIKLLREKDKILSKLQRATLLFRSNEYRRKENTCSVLVYRFKKQCFYSRLFFLVCTRSSKKLGLILTLSNITKLLNYFRRQLLRNYSILRNTKYGVLTKFSLFCTPASNMRVVLVTFIVFARNVLQHTTVPALVQEASCREEPA